VDVPSQIASELLRTLDKPTILFAGAGVGKRANLMDWHEYMEYLAVTAANYEVETAGLIRKRTGQDRLPEAARLFKICSDIPEGERRRAAGYFAVSFRSSYGAE